MKSDGSAGNGIKLMTYMQMMHAAKSDDPVARERAREHYLMRLKAKRIEHRLRMIERDALCKLFGMDPVQVHALWVKGER